MTEARNLPVNLKAAGPGNGSHGAIAPVSQAFAASGHQEIGLSLPQNIARQVSFKFQHQGSGARREAVSLPLSVSLSLSPHRGRERFRAGELRAASASWLIAALPVLASPGTGAFFWDSNTAVGTVRAPFERGAS